MAAVLLAACTHSAGTGANVSPQDVYATSLSLDNMQSLLGGGSWWMDAPSFQVRPLQIETLPQQIKFAVTNRYVNLGTSDEFNNDLEIWDTATDAGSHMTAVQNALGTSINGPRIGDQQLYYQESPGPGNPAYTALAFIRLGPAVDSLTWTSGTASPSLSRIGKVANQQVARLRSALGGKLRASPPPTNDLQLLPPVNQDITLLGMTRLPIETFPLMINVAAPEDMAKTLHGLGVNDFVFGDYALINDTQMEVRAAELDFSAATDASGLVDAFRGSPDTSTPFFELYQDSSGPGQYYVMFAAKTHFGILICRNTAITIAAARSCENPLTRIANAWYGTLSA